MCTVGLPEEPQGQQCGAVLCWEVALAWGGCRLSGKVDWWCLSPADCSSRDTACDLPCFICSFGASPAWAALLGWVGERRGRCGELGREWAGLASWEQQGGTTEQSGLSPCSLDMDMTNASHSDFHTNSFSEEFSTFA